MSESHGWRDVLAVFLQAGSGLAAAHLGGVVHRDFKPDNAMVSESGRVVLDFVLARPDPAAGGDSAQSTLSSAISTLDLTRTGSLLGTPAYMSPEQFLSARVDERSHQFSFCVCMFAALYGFKPFVGSDFAALRAAVLEHVVAPPPRGTEVPGYMHQALLRGLDREPGRRWHDMTALLAALSTDPSARRRRRLGIAGVILASGVAAAAAAQPQRRAVPHRRGAVRARQALSRGGGNDSRARSMAADAQKNFAVVGPGFQVEEAEVKTWVAQLPSG